MYKKEFPLLDKHLVTYLDSAASAQKPGCVLAVMDDFYQNYYANIHRGQCEIALRATEKYEDARQTVAGFLGCCSENIIFTKGATESINMVAGGYGQLLQPGDEVLVCIAEHHANFVPWQQVCLRTGAVFKTFDVLDNGQIDLSDFASKLNHRTKLVAVSQMSNVLGVINPVTEIVKKAHNVGARVLVDGAQSIAHIPVNVSESGCDFFVFSGHKIYGPTGIGVLYGRTDALQDLPPCQFGGDMVRTVTPEKTVFADIPARFEAGTVPFIEAVGLAEAIRFVSKIGMKTVFEHEEKLTRDFMSYLKTIPDLNLMGDELNKQGIISFNIKGIHPADLGFVLAKNNICVRIGHHCAMPLHQRFNTDVSLRVSFGIYNDQKDIDTFKNAFQKAISLFGGK